MHVFLGGLPYLLSKKQRCQVFVLGEHIMFATNSTWYKMCVGLSLITVTLKIKYLLLSRKAESLI